VTLGLGSAIASGVAAAPWLAAVGANKGLVFGVAGVLMALNYWLLVVRPRQCAPGEVCHVDSPLMRWNRRVYWLSAGIYVAALVLTYGAIFWVERL
jgi:hypothetical protein